MKKRKNIRIVNVMILLVVAIVAVWAIVFAAIRKPGDNHTNIKANSVASSQSMQKDASGVTQRPPLAYYVSGVSSNLFTNPADTAPPPVSSNTSTQPPVNTAPVVVDPLGDYSYTGTVTLNGQMLALVENKKTNDGQYLKCGDNFLGGDVKQISDTSLTLSIAGKSRTMSKTDNFKLVPLDKDAVMPKQAEPTPEKAKTNDKTNANDSNQNNQRANFFQRFRGRFRGGFPPGGFRPGGGPPPGG